MARHLSISNELAAVVDKMRKEMTNPYNNKPASHTEALSSLIGKDLLMKYGEDFGKKSKRR